RSDLAVFRPETGTWYVKLSTNGTVNSRAHGTSLDVLTPGDYDGDGKTDHAVWENATGNWNILRSGTGALSGQQWGINGDIPAPSAYIP
ncbi:MAG: VCBS repeat-containing protein, partial [Pyrinomonadaceae bacterium]|nr:VCBS repeat-containing protein [Pyrinomonadaceae bacterium]